MLLLLLIAELGAFIRRGQFYGMSYFSEQPSISLATLESVVCGGSPSESMTRYLHLVA